MGHLFSRAFKRITQLSSSRNSSTSQQPEQLDTGEQDVSQRQQGRPSLHETIPVGQSIDSSEYRALDSNDEQKQIDTSNQENTAPISSSTTTTTNATATINNNANNNEGNKQDVEEAVIKIQALVRGHLTRKALKDAHHPSLPAQNALGQCQFDEESLTRNPPSAVFLPSSPLNYLSNDGQFTTTQNNSRTSPPVSTTTTTSLSSSDQHQQQHQPSRTPLESIAEVTETVTLATQDLGSESSDNKPVSRHDLAASESAASKLDMPVSSKPTSGVVELKSSGGPNSQPSVLLSKQLSEANTSIDLNCDETPTSASILISDHNIKSSDRIASVLHYKEDKQQQQQQQQQQQSGATPANTRELPRVGVVADEQRSHNNCDLNNGIESQEQQQGMLATDSLDSEEAAAIRIQSAFRGYRTRKNSPYRTRSPSSSIDATMKRNGICQQTADTLNETTHRDHDIAALVSNEEQIEAARLVGRRESRQRYRDLSPTQQQVIIADDHQRTSGGIQEENRVAVDEQQRVGLIQAATSVEEFTTTEDTTNNTVKEATFEVPNQQEQQRQALSKTELQTTETPRQTIAADQSAVLESVNQQSDEPNNNPVSESSCKADGLSLSFDIAGGLSEEANTLDETGLSAALEAVQETNTDDLIENGAGEGILCASLTAPRPSEASVELDTDSSVLGAALSLNEDITSATNNYDLQQLQQRALDGDQTGGVPMQQLQDRPIDDDKSLGVSLITDELEFEARRLVDELNREAEEAAANNQEDRDEERGDNIGAIVEDEEVIDDQEIILNEEEQRVIEMESDDIERRDPRGQASEERAKSPQIRSSEEEPKFNVTTTTTELERVGSSEKADEIGEGESDKEKEKEKEKEKDKTEEVKEEEIIGSTGAHLEVQSPDDGRTSSGRSSPALNSSAANSSYESDDNSEAGTSPTTTTKQQAQAQGNSQTRQQQQNNQQTGKNKRKNRKRKAKK